MPPTFRARGVPLNRPGTTSPVRIRVTIGREELRPGTAASTAAALRSEMVTEAGAMGREIVARAKALAPVDTSNYRGSLRNRVRLRGFDQVDVLVDAGARYAAVIEKGRRAGARMPPVRALIPWVRRNLGVTGARARGVAFAVARKIVRRGLPAQNVLKRATEETKRSRPRRFRSAIRRWRRKRFGIGEGRP